MHRLRWSLHWPASSRLAATCAASSFVAPGRKRATTRRWRLCPAHCRSAPAWRVSFFRMARPCITSSSAGCKTCRQSFGQCGWRTPAPPSSCSAPPPARKWRAGNWRLAIDGEPRPRCTSPAGRAPWRSSAPCCSRPATWALVALRCGYRTTAASSLCTELPPRATRTPRNSCSSPLRRQMPIMLGSSLSPSAADCWSPRLRADGRRMTRSRAGRLTRLSTSVAASGKSGCACKSRRCCSLTGWATRMCRTGARAGRRCCRRPPRGMRRFARS
mmetsp:Transcript_170222/g.545898  ORF Transcript_170222/g.545898 Transcript_170222/m.545898 type:complete len:273 (+) Transcript_170222:82-900(+)